ncbi:MAG: hypothetical protein FWH11_00015 [Micrococcales bacterium]|nr:hypothetical protein [Micrococcales bacterium]
MKINGHAVDQAIIDSADPVAQLMGYFESDKVVASAELDEIVGIARGRGLMPDAVSDLAGSPGKITAKVYADRLPGLTGAKRMAAKAAGAIGVTVTTELSDTTFTVVIAASARGINVSEMVAGEIRKVLARLPRRVPAGLVSVRTGEGRTMVDVDLAQAAEQYKVRPTAIEIGDTITFTAERV